MSTSIILRLILRLSLDSHIFMLGRIWLSSWVVRLFTTSRASSPDNTQHQRSYEHASNRYLLVSFHLDMLASFWYNEVCLGY